MPSYRIGMFLAAFAALAAGPGVPRAAAAETGSEKDELAEGDWRGEKKWDHLEAGGGAGTPTPAPGTTTPPPGGTATPTPAGSAPSPTGTPTVPTGPAEPELPTGPGEPEEPTGPAGPAGLPVPSLPTGPALPSQPAQPDPAGQPGPLFPPAPPPPAPLPPTTPSVSPCNARWVCEVVEAVPALYEAETLLTLTLFRTDAFAFVSNGYCRSESTWFVDLVETTSAGHEGMSSFRVEVRLEHPCPNCKPKIDLRGISQLQARVQTKTPWSDVDASTTASASASTLWAGDLDCGDRCGAGIADNQGTGEISVGADPLKITRVKTKGYVRVNAEGGKGDANRIDDARTSLLIVDRGSVSTYAAGTDDNAQAKCRAGYFLVIKGESACGPWGEYEVAIRE